MTTLPDDLDFANVDELIAALADAGVTATMNENDVRAPGVWVRFSGLPDSPLGGCTIGLTLYAVVDKISDRSLQMAALAALWNKVRPVVQHFGGPNGTPVPVGLPLPGNATTALPSLAIPLDLITTT